MKKNLKVISLFILLIVVFQMGVTKVGALTVDSLKYKIINHETHGTTTFDLYGSINSSTVFGTTYDNNGYFTYLKVGDNDLKIVNKVNEDTNIDGINVNIGLSEGNDAKSVIVKYTLTNTTNENKIGLSVN